MKDSYSLDADWEGLEKQYRAHFQAYFNIFSRCSLPTIAVKSDVGMMGGKLAHEFMYLTPIGEDTLILCGECGYTANRQIATFQKPEPPDEEPLPLEKVATPEAKTIEALANFLDVHESKTAKAVFLMATVTEGKEDVEKFVFAIVRGDMDLNETKLTNATNAKALRSATEAEIIVVGAVPGYASPVGLRNNVIVVVDDLIAHSPNLVAGANEEGYHLRNVNYGRDYEADVVTDIVSAEEGYACPNCGSPVQTSRGVETGNIFQLGTRYSDDDNLGCTFLDKDGNVKPVIMGSYGIGSGRLLACIAEEHNDEHGLIWPITVAPYQVHLIVLKGAEYAANVIYEQLLDAGVEVLYDDRDESAGIKFNDADLIGIPLRITVGKRGLERGEVELKHRSEAARRLVPIDEVVQVVQEEIVSLEAAIMEKVVVVPYKG